MVVVRHGETEWNADGRIQGHQPVPLNARGRKQAVLLGSRLAFEQVETIYSSDLLRTMETAQAIAEGQGECLIEQERDLREWSLSRPCRAS